MSCWGRSSGNSGNSNSRGSKDSLDSNNSKFRSRSPSPQIKRLTVALFGGTNNKSSEGSSSSSAKNIHKESKPTPFGPKMGNSCSYNLKQLPTKEGDTTAENDNYTSRNSNNSIKKLQKNKLHKSEQNITSAATNGTNGINNNEVDLYKSLQEMADSEDVSPNSSTVLNGTSQLGLINGGAQSSGNVQSKAAAFSRLNSQASASQQQTVNSSSRRIVSGVSSFHHQHQTNESQTMKQSSTQHVKSNLSEMQSRMSQMKALSQQTTTSSSSSASASSSSSISTSTNGQKASKLASMGLTPLKLMTNHHDDDSDTPLDTGTVLVQEIPFPSPSEIGSMTPVLHVGDLPTSPLASPNLVLNNHTMAICPPSGSTSSTPLDKDGTQSFHFQQKKVASSSSTKYQSGNFKSEQASTNAAEMKRVQAGDVTYEENSHAAAIKEKVQMDGVTTEKKAAMLEEQRALTQAGVTDEETRRAAAASVKLSTDTFTAEKVKAMTEHRQTRLNQGRVLNSEKTVTGLSQSKLTFKNQLTGGDTTVIKFEDLDSLGWGSPTQDVGRVTDKYATELSSIVESLRESSEEDNADSVSYLDYASKVMKAAWKVPGHGHQVGGSLCKTFREMGGLDLLIGNFSSRRVELRVASARLLEQSLTPENCNYVVEKGFDCLDKVVKVASDMCEVEESRVGTGLFRHLFRHSESTCSDVLRLQGLERIMAECRRMDVETLRNCAGALVNLSLYGGAENQEAMIKRKVHLWLFPLAFHHDDSIKYYACLAIAVLSANKEIEAQIIKSNTLQLVEPFLTSHNPEEFAASNSSHGQGQTAQWLEKFVPVLSSQREEARSLAAFHFCMEAGIKKRQNLTHIFKQINAIEPLKRVASSPNALASKLAAQALRLIGETVPHKLSQQVPLWSIEDVREWVIQKGFDQYADSFAASRVDGDLLLQLTEDMLCEDIKMDNGILRKRFMRDLWHLKKMADYSSCDSTNLNEYLSSIQSEFSAYTYTLLNNGVDKETLRKCVSDDVLAECGVQNSIHRNRIIDALREKSELSSTSEENLEKPLDVFISYRRSNGAQLASLLKVHLALRGFSVFIDVERLEAGKFDNNLLQSITQAKHFVLVLTPESLDRCIGDSDRKDWVHREIVAALQSQCNIVPIIDQFFQWPECDKLPEDMQSVHTFNGVKWIHDYQDACVDKLERFLRGEQIPREPVSMNNSLTPSTGASTPRASTVSQPQYLRTASVGSDESSERRDKKSEGH